MASFRLNRRESEPDIPNAEAKKKGGKAKAAQRPYVQSVQRQAVVRAACAAFAVSAHASVAIPTHPLSAGQTHLSYLGIVQSIRIHRIRSAGIALSVAHVPHQ